ncbi:unnamed protein product, partial [Prunus brigantina]
MFLNLPLSELEIQEESLCQMEHENAKFLMLKEISMMKMSLHMRNSGNLLNNCTAMSH